MNARERLKKATAAALTTLAMSATAIAQATVETRQPPTSEAAGNRIVPDSTAPLNPQNYIPQVKSQPPTRSENLPDSSPPAPVIDADSTDYSWLLDQVRQKRQEATANLRAQQQTTANHDSLRGDEHRRIHELRRNYEDQDSQLQDREDRVNRQLDRLERLLKEHEVLNENATQPVAPDTNQAPQVSTPEPDQQGPDPEEQPGMNTRPMDDQTNTVESGTDPPDTDTSEHSPATTTPSLSPSQVDAIALTNQTVDSLSLANNLFGTGEHSLALKIYSKIDLSNMVPEDKVWIRFQIANCHRRLGSISEAERGYRIVTTAAGESWVGQTARWWLDATARTARLKQRIKSLENNHVLLRKEINDPIAEP